MNYHQIKLDIFSYFHDNLRQIAIDIADSQIDRKKKSTQINNAIDSVKKNLSTKLLCVYPNINKSKLLMTLQYCYSVISLEYRNKVWPYEYMAFSRRNGELWERFCKSAWDNSQLPSLCRIDAPNFNDVKNKFKNRIISYTNDNPYQECFINDIDSIFELVGEINMIEDEMFNLNGSNYIIDFKSGFGSNEKGNMLRLIAVGKAYKHWDPNVNLLFLVRQNENNNYLETIRKSGLWDVRCGDAAYNRIDELTGAGICEIRKDVIDFRRDLSPAFWDYLSKNSLTSYLNW